MSFRQLFWVLLILFLTLTDCTCFNRRIVVRSVLLEMPTSVAGFAKKLDREKFSDLVKIVIEKDPNFQFDPERTDGEVLHLSLILPQQMTANTPIILVGSLDKTLEGATVSAKAFSDIVVEEGRISGTAVSDGITKVMQNLYLLRHGNVSDGNFHLKKLEQAVRGEGLAPGELINSISVLGEMKETAAEPYLITLLQKTDSISVGNASMVALGELKSQAAMPAIIDFAERKPPVLRRQAIIAARSIASREAAEWLLVMAYGHDDPVVRSEAMVALADVETRLGLNQP